MLKLKCPKCGEPIEATEGTLAVRCPHCAGEFKVKQPWNRPQQPAATPPEAARPIVVGPATPLIAPPASPHVASMHAMSPARPQTAHGNASAILAIVLLVLLAVGVIAAVKIYLRGGVKTIEKGGGVLAGGTKEPTGNKAPPLTHRPNNDADKPKPVGPRPDPASGGPLLSAAPLVNLKAYMEGAFHPSDLDDTEGWFAGKVQSHESKIIEEATFAVELINVEGRPVRRVPLTLRIIPPNETLPFCVRLSGVSISALDAGKTKFELTGVQWAGDDVRMMQYNAFSKRILPGADDLSKDRFSARLNNTSGGTLYNVRVRVEGFSPGGKLLTAEEAVVKNGDAIPANNYADFTLAFDSDQVLNPASTNWQVRAMGKFVASGRP